MSKAVSIEQKAAADLIARAGGYLDFPTFAAYQNPKHYLPKHSHLEIVAKHLKDVFTGKIKRLIINLPPGFAKSDYVTRLFTSWYIGKRPYSDIIIAAYSDEIAKDFAGDVKTICGSERFTNIFSRLKIEADTRAKNNWRVSTGAKPLGRIIAAGINGQITSRRAHLAIIDDPLKNIVDASSYTITNKQFDWYRTVIRTRLHPLASVILIMTRWTSHDLSARLMADTGEYGEKWTVCKLPALDKNNESIWPVRYSTQEIQSIRASISERFFQALYMQDPQDSGSSMLGDLIIGTFPEKHKSCIATLDPKYQGKDTMGLSIMATDNDNQVYVTGYCFYGDVRVEKANIVAKLIKHNVGTLYIESQADQGFSIELFKPFWPAVKKIHNSVNKHIRITVNVGNNLKRLIFDKECQQDYLLQISDYQEGKDPDDCIDSLASACALIFKQKKVYNLGMGI